MLGNGSRGLIFLTMQMQMLPVKAHGINPVKSGAKAPRFIAENDEGSRKLCYPRGVYEFRLKVSIRNNKNNVKVVLIMGTTTLKSKVQKHEDSCAGN